MTDKNSFNDYVYSKISENIDVLFWIWASCFEKYFYDSMIYKNIYELL